MDNRKIACFFAAAFLGLTLTAGATSTVHAKKPVQITVQAVDPALQRRVSYADLNMAERSGQKVLSYRIAYTARDLCTELNGSADDGCVRFAIGSTKDQVAQVIYRAERQLAGLPVGPAIAIAMVIGVH